MSARSRLRTAAAISFTTALTAGTALLLSACGPTAGSKATGSVPAAASTTSAPTGVSPASTTPTLAIPPTTVPAGSPAPAQPRTGGAPAPVVNGTAHNGLTISNGTRYVLMNGTSVDFGTTVRDLAWSPDGTKAAFVDGSGDLAISRPDGGGRVVVARNPGGQAWSHPTWQVTGADNQYQLPAKNNLFFAVSQNGTYRLESVPATAVDGTPQPLPLEHGSGENVTPLPQTGNIWPNTGGGNGSSVYANSTTGDVYIRDDYLRQQGGEVTQGSEPALSPDGGEIVFVRSVGGHDHLFEHSLDGRTVRDLTPNATTDYTEPAWSTDGRTIAARVPDGVATLPADGSAAPARVSNVPGLPAYRA